MTKGKLLANQLHCPPPVKKTLQQVLSGLSGILDAATPLKENVEFFGSEIIAVRNHSVTLRANVNIDDVGILEDSRFHLKRRLFFFYRMIYKENKIS